MSSGFIFKLKKQFSCLHFIFCSDKIVNVSPSDFDGDGCLDVLITTESRTADKTVTVYVYWGNSQTLGIPGNSSLLM